MNCSEVGQKQRSTFEASGSSKVASEQRVESSTQRTGGGHRDNGREPPGRVTEFSSGLELRDARDCLDREASS
jgi:hypothetical protein